MLSLLGVETEVFEVDMLKGEHKAPAFLAINPLGQVPVLEADGVFIHDSNACLVYLARTFDSEGEWMPNTALEMARVERWLAMAAGWLAEGPGTARRAKVFRAPLELTRPHAIAARLLTYMNAVLNESAFLTGTRPTIADVAMYTYTALAPEGDISLEPYALVREWLTRIESLPGFVPMERWTDPAQQ